MLRLSAGRVSVSGVGAMNARLAVAVACLGLVLAGWAASPAPAAFPGQNGKIAFDTLRDGNVAIYVMDADGAGQTNLTGTTNDDFEPAWSADGQRIAFTSFRDGNNEIYVMNANGAGQTNLTNNASSDDTPAWSPDGQKIAFTSTRDGAANGEIYVMNADGSGQTNLSNNAAFDREPTWSPDGSRIAFERGHEIFVMNADGSGQTNLSNNAAADDQPAWSPDGQKLAFRSTRGGNVEVFVMNADGSGQTNLSNNAADDREPAWAPDGSKIAFERDTDVFTMNADGSAPTNLTNRTGFDGTPDWQPIPTAAPIVFVHGFLGSKILCGGAELWPNLPSPRLPEMELEPDGQTNAGCASAGPAPGQLVENAPIGPISADVYGSTVAFLRDLQPDDFHLYAWDWRKNPEEAVAGLDALIDEVRDGPDGQVVLMAHSMGGLVVRSYVEDAARAEKVARAVTVATPYWGSPKSLFPFVYGVEAPGLSELDGFFDNDELREFARHLQGLFFLWPSARYGPWLSIEDRPSPLSQDALLDFVEERDGNRSLLATALGAHAARLDELRTNGVDYQTVIGSGIHTIGSVEIESSLVLGLLPSALGGPLELVHVNWVNGDGTVPLSSARAATPAVRQHFTCAIKHVPLPGHSSVTSRLRGFLLEGLEIDTLPVSGVLCDPQGFALSVFPLGGGVFTSRAPAPRMLASRGTAPGSLTFEQAEQQGLLEMVNTGAQIEAATSTTAPLTLSLQSRGAALRIAPMQNGEQGKARTYGPVGRGVLTIELGAAVTVKQNGKMVKPSKDDNKAPKTRVRILPGGPKLTLQFTIRDASPVSTYVKYGKRVKEVRKTLRVSAARLRKGVYVQSVDAFGNAEEAKRIKRR